MATITFDRDAMARWYAGQHLKSDPGVVEVVYLPHDAPDREIRFVEINDMIVDRTHTQLEPITFGIERGSETEHRLCMVDVTREQWKKLLDSRLSLPQGWSLVDAEHFA